MKNVIGIIRFGSTINNNGQNNPLSDIDVCIITSKNITKKEKEKILFFKDEKLDLVIFEDIGLPMQYEILTTGKIIKSKTDLNSLIKSNKREWADFKPILNRIYLKNSILPII